MTKRQTEETINQAGRSTYPDEKSVLRTEATRVNAGAGAVDRSLKDVILAADLGDYQASGVLIGLYGQKQDAPVPNILAYLQRHVERGHAYAQYALALAYDYGHHGLSPDPEKAFELYSLAARQDDAYAQCCMGICYAYGHGVQQNDEEAVRWYQQAARRGSAQAQCNLGYSYEIGRRPLEKSMREANRWYRRSAMRDFAVAQHNLGMSYELGRELPQDCSIANRWYARAANQGMAAAQCKLGFSYERGRGVAQNYARAAELYAAAAESGYAQAQQNYGYLVENGLGVDRNEVDAVRWYSLAAGQGLGSAQSCLAFMYETGTGVPKSLKDALAHYERAAAQSDERAIEGVRRITWKLAVEEARADLNALDEELLRTDPRYPEKRPALIAAVKPMLSKLKPQEWRQTYEEAYRNL